MDAENSCHVGRPDALAPRRQPPRLARVARHATLFDGPLPSGAVTARDHIHALSLCAGLSSFTVLPTKDLTASISRWLFRRRQNPPRRMYLPFFHTHTFIF